MKIAASPGRDILAGRHPTFTLPSGLDEVPGWRRAGELCRLWADPSLPLHRAVQGVWLRFSGEADAGVGPEWISCFFEPKAAPGEAEERAEWILRRVVPLLRGAPLPPSPARTVAAGLQAAGRHADLLQVWVCADEDRIRLCLYPRSHGGLPACLAALGWSGFAGEGDGLLSLLARTGAQLCLIVELTASLCPVAVECHFNGLPGPEKKLAWDTLLAVLEESGLCTESQRRSLLAFHGYTVEDFFVPRALIRALQHARVAGAISTSIPASATSG